MNSPEDIFKKAFENFESTPPDDAWQNIDNQLKFKSFFRFFPKRLNIYYVAIVATVAATIYYYSSNNHNEPITINSVEQSANLINASQRKVIIPNTPKHNNNKTHSIADNNKITIIDKKLYLEENTEIPVENQPITNNNLSTENNQETTNEAIDNDFSADFIVQLVDSCSPSTVKFINISKNVDYCIWNLGNGTTSYDEEATATYRTAGTYYVTLKTVKGTNSKVSAQTVTINPTPSATIAHTKALTKTPMIAEIRNAQNVTHTKWLFEDQTTSASHKVAHQYKNEGIYTLSLVISNQYCTDTITENIEVTAPEYSISFPNALYASSSGAIDGFGGRLPKFAPFSPKGDVDMIDRYKLRIYSKSGKEVFESNNPAYGWNGYNKGQKLPAGVYVYKAVYTFINGEYYTTEGNITLIFGE